MYTRILKTPNDKSFFLLGPRATGKSTWLKQHYPDAVWIDLLRPEMFNQLLARPEELETLIPKNQTSWVVIDEIQRVPELLNVVHLLIETKKLKFALTGSSARKLRKSGVNLLAGRALSYKMFPMTANELGEDFDLEKSLLYGHLPSVFSENDKGLYLSSYVQTYLREEVQQEGLTRNLTGFSRFLEASSFSQGSVLNISDVARDCSIDRKAVEGFFTILEDLLIGHRIGVFNKRAKRKTVAHKKFYFFDVGVFRSIRPAGPLDNLDLIPGASFESLVFQEIMALNHYLNLGYELFYWRTTAGLEVDFILYGPRGILAIECKSSSRIRPSDLKSLKQFCKDYPSAKPICLYAGKDVLDVDGVQVLPAQKVLPELAQYIS